MSVLEIVQAAPEHDELLYRIYAESRSEELSAWGWGESERETFLRMQYELRRRSYAMQAAAAEHGVIVWNGTPVGHLIVEEGERYIRLINVALLEAYRNQGIGSRLIASLQQKAARAGKSVVLSVDAANRARRLYERLGFRPIGQSVPYTWMEWIAGDEQAMGLHDSAREDRRFVSRAARGEGGTFPPAGEGER
jgi:ribosomal protein S18 acetylase RimI-like enzyme